ncbi:MAG: YidC/Oxa1 family membrane protein insertase, partial [Acidimicrobiales bacterium]
MLHIAVLAAAAAAKSDKLTGLNALLEPISKPIAEILAGFYAVIPNFGVAILLLSIVWMIIIAPLNLKATRSMLAMQKLQPQMKRLMEEHKNDRVASSQAMQELYREHNVSPWGSCLPTLLPLPVFIALFEVIDGLSHSTVTGKPEPRFLSAHTQMYTAIVQAHGHLNALGMDLSKNALSSHSSFGGAIPYFALLLIMMGAQYLQTAQMMRRNPAAGSNPQMKFMKYLPFVLGLICIRFPAGVILYYATSAVFRIAQQTLMYRYDPKVRALVSQDIQQVETLTRDIEAAEERVRRGGRSQQGAPKPQQGAPKPPQGGP